MASTGDPLSVNSDNTTSVTNKFNQISGIKKGLESVIADTRKTYEDKFGSLISSWECLFNFVSSKQFGSAHQSNITSLIKWIHPITIKLVVHTDFQKLRNISKTTISHALRRCRVLVKAQEDIQILESLLGLIKDPWNDPVLVKLFDKSKLNIDHVKDSEVLAFCNSQGAMTLALRLEALANSYCDNLCANLSEACMRCLTLKGCNLGELGIDGDKCYIHYIIDIRVAILVKQKQLKKVFGQFNNYGLEEVRKLVYRFRERIPPVSAEKPNLWSCSSDVLIIAVQYCVTKAMVAPVNNVEQATALMTLWVEQNSNLSDGILGTAKGLCKTAASSRHVFLFADVLKRKFGAKYTSIYIEYYIRGLTMGVNELEYLKSFKVKDLALIREMEIRMSDGFIKLASLAKVNDVVYRECFLTAFSLNPTKECLDELKRIGEQRHQTDPFAGSSRPHVCVPHAACPDYRVIPNGDGCDPAANNNSNDTVNKVIAGSGVTGSGETTTNVDRPIENGTNLEGVKVGVLCSMCGTFLPEETSQNEASWSQVTVDNEGLGLSPEDCDDLLVVLSSPRWRLLSWNLSWPELAKACELYLQNAPLRNTEKELNFLSKNIDYNQFDCWKYPKVCEEEYPGIEKGYEGCLLAEDDDEEEEIEEPPRKSKTLKKQNGFVDSDSSADRRKKARRKWKKTDDVDYKVRPRAKPRVTKKRNLFLSSVSEYETTTQDSVRTDGNSDTYSLSPVEMDRSPANRKIDMVLDCPPLKLPPIAFGFDENGKKFANIVDSKRLSDPKTLKQLRMFRNPAKKPSPEKKDKDFNNTYAPRLSTIDLNPRILLHRTEEPLTGKKPQASLTSKNVIRASLENYLPRSDRVPGVVSPASAKSRPVMGLDFLSSVLLAQERPFEEETDDRQLMKAHIPGLTSLDMIVPLPAETSVHIVQLPQSVASTGSGQGGGQSVPPPKPAAQTSAPPAPPITQPPAAATVSQPRTARDRVTITSLLQSQPGLSYSIRSVQAASASKPSNETATSETAKSSEETPAPPAETSSSQADANESLPKFHQAFTKTSRVHYCQPGGAVATSSQESTALPEDAPEAVVSSSPGIPAVKVSQTSQAQCDPTGHIRQPLHVHVSPIRPPAHVVQVGTGQTCPPGQVVQIGSGGQLRQPSVVQLGPVGQLKQAGQIVQVSPAGQIGRAVQMTQVIQSPRATANPVGQITPAGLIGQASQVITGQIAQANQPGQPSASISNLNLVMTMPPILRVVQNPTVYIGQISSAAKTSFLAASGDAASPSMSIVLAKDSRPGFVNRATTAPPESSSDDDASLPKPPNYAPADDMATSAGDLSPRSTSTYEQLQEFESVLKQIKEKGEIQADVTSPVASTAVVHAVQAGAIGTIPCVKVPMVRIPAANTTSGSTLKTVGAKGAKLLMVTTNCPSLPAPATPTVASPGKTPPKSGKTSKPKPAKTSPTVATAAAAAAKASPIAKPQQKPQEDEQTTQRIYDILNQYAEQLRNSPDLNNKPAPRRRSNPPTNPGPSKRKKSSAKAKSTAAEMSPGVDDPTADEDDSSSTTLIHMGGVHDSPAPSQQSADEGASQSVGTSLEASTEGGNLKSVVMDQESSKEKPVEAEASPSPTGSKPMLVASSSGGGHLIMTPNIRQLLMQSFMKSPGKVIHVMNGPGRGANMQIVVRHATATGKTQGLTALSGGSSGSHQQLDNDSIALGLSPLRAAISSVTAPLTSENRLETAQPSRRDVFQCTGMEVTLKEVPPMFHETVAVSSTPAAAIGTPTAKEETVVISATGEPITMLDEVATEDVVVESSVEDVDGSSFAQEISAGTTTDVSHTDLEVDSASTELSEAQKIFECAENDEEEEIDTEPEIMELEIACTSSSATATAAALKPAPSKPEAATFLAGIINAIPEGSGAITANISRKQTLRLSDADTCQNARAASKVTDGSSEDETVPFAHLDAGTKPGFSGDADGAPKKTRDMKQDSSRPILSKNPTGVVRKYKGKRPVADGSGNAYARKVAIALRASSRPYSAQPLLKSLSEECEDLGVDRPSTNDLFPETLLMMDADTSSSPGFEMAAVVPCPIDLNKHVPMFSGVTIGDNIEIATNVEIGSSIEIESNVEIDTTMEIAENVEIGSSVDQGWNGSNDDSQLPRSRASSTSSSTSSSHSSSSSDTSSNSSGGKPLSTSEIGEDECTPVPESTEFSSGVELTEKTINIESPSSAPDASPDREELVTSLQTTAIEKGEATQVQEADRYTVPIESTTNESNRVAVVVILPSEGDSSLGNRCNKTFPSAAHSDIEPKCWPVVDPSTNTEPLSTSDLGVDGSKSTESPSGHPTSPVNHSVLAKLVEASPPTSPSLKENLLQKSVIVVETVAAEEDVSTNATEPKPAIADLNDKASSRSQLRSSVIVTTAVAETETEPESDVDNTFFSMSSCSENFTTALDVTAVSCATEIDESTLEEEPGSDNDNIEKKVSTVGGNETLLLDCGAENVDVGCLVEENKPIVDTFKQENVDEGDGPPDSRGVVKEDVDENIMEKNFVKVEAKDLESRSSSGADCLPRISPVSTLMEVNVLSCEASTGCVDGQDDQNALCLEVDSIAPTSTAAGSLASSEASSNDLEDAQASDHIEESSEVNQQAEDICGEAANVSAVEKINETSELTLHAADPALDMEENIVVAVKLEAQAQVQTQSIVETASPPISTPNEVSENVLVKKDASKSSDGGQQNISSSPEPDIVALQAGSISPGSSGQYNYDAEDSNGVDLSSVSIPGEAEQLSEQDVSEDDAHSPCSNTNDETKALPPRYKVAPVERVNTRSLSRGYSRSQSSQDGSISVEQAEVTEPPKKRLIKRRPVWEDLFPNKVARRKKMKVSTAASTDDTTTSDEEVPKRRFNLPVIKEEALGKLPTVVEDPAEESTDQVLKQPTFVKGTTIEGDSLTKTPSAKATAQKSQAIIPLQVDQLVHKPKKRGRKPRAAASVGVEAGELPADARPLPSHDVAAIEGTSIAIKPKPKRAPVNWTDKDKAIKLAKERVKDTLTLPGRRRKRLKKESGATAKKPKADLNGGPSGVSGPALLPLINGDSVSMVIEAVVAAAAQNKQITQSSEDSLPSLLGSDSQESGAGGSSQTSDSTECNPGRSNSTNGLLEPAVPKKRGRKKKRERAEPSETESSDLGGSKKTKIDCVHASEATPGASSSSVKRSQRSHKVKGCDCCNGASTKKKDVSLALKKEHSKIDKVDLTKGDKRVEKKNEKEAKSERKDLKIDKKDGPLEKEENKMEKGSKSDKEPKTNKDFNLEKDATYKVEKKDVSSNVERREATKLEKESEKCPGNLDKGKKSAATKSSVKLNNYRKR